jgi:hypothetical protein
MWHFSQPLTSTFLLLATILLIILGIDVQDGKIDLVFVVYWAVAICTESNFTQHLYK